MRHNIANPGLPSYDGSVARTKSKKGKHSMNIKVGKQAIAEATKKL